MLHLCSFKMRAVPHYILRPLPSGASSPFLPGAAGWLSYSPVRAQFKHQLLLEDFPVCFSLRRSGMLPTCPLCTVGYLSHVHHTTELHAAVMCLVPLCSALAKCLVHSRCLKHDQKRMKKCVIHQLEGKVTWVPFIVISEKLKLHISLLLFWLLLNISPNQSISHWIVSLAHLGWFNF